MTKSEMLAKILKTYKETGHTFPVVESQEEISILLTKKEFALFFENLRQDLGEEGNNILNEQGFISLYCTKEKMIAEELEQFLEVLRLTGVLLTPKFIASIAINCLDGGFPLLWLDDRATSQFRTLYTRESWEAWNEYNKFLQKKCEEVIK